MFIDISLIQPVPLSNLNRDDLGAPKTVVYGGATRTRVSSQSWKRQVRLEIERNLADPAVRTRRILTEVARLLTGPGYGWEAAEAEAAAAQVALSTGKGLKLEKDGSTSVLMYLPTGVIAQLADLAVAHREAILTEAARKTPKAILPADEILAVLSGRNGTISLFGRMLAELPSTEVDGAVQVAHAFTVHATAPEIDFFTAVDDLNAADDRGSGHMNSAEFAAGVFYRYACVNVRGLLHNLNDDQKMAEELTTAFLTAFISTLPTGKQNSTAANTLPELCHLAVRADRPISLAGAFETPLSGAGGHSLAARYELADYARQLNRLWGQAGLRYQGHAGFDKPSLNGLGPRVDSYHDLIDQAVTAAYGGPR